MDEDTKKVVIDYIKEQRINSAGTKKIKEFCATQPPVSKTVFRGHKRSREIRFNANWYSASELVKVAREEFASADCCVFTIHLVDIPIIDVNKFVGEEIGHYKEEQEIIFLGGGAFYQDKKGHERGFIEKAAGEFECWYMLDKEEAPSPSPSSQKTPIEKTLFALIPEDEYEFIDAPEDIFFSGHELTTAQKRTIFTMIPGKQGVLNDGGGNITKTRSRKSRSRKRATKKSSRKKKKSSRTQHKSRRKKSSRTHKKSSRTQHKKRRKKA